MTAKPLIRLVGVYLLFCYSFQGLWLGPFWDEVAVAPFESKVVDVAPPRVTTAGHRLVVAGPGIGHGFGEGLPLLRPGSCCAPTTADFGR